MGAVDVANEVAPQRLGVALGRLGAGRLGGGHGRSGTAGSNGEVQPAPRTLAGERAGDVGADTVPLPRWLWLRHGGEAWRSSRALEDKPFVTGAATSAPDVEGRSSLEYDGVDSKSASESGSTPWGREGGAPVGPLASPFPRTELPCSTPPAPGRPSSCTVTCPAPAPPGVSSGEGSKWTILRSITA